MAGSNAARGDGKDSVKTFHKCDEFTSTAGCSTNVFINGIGAVRLGDACARHNVEKAGGDEGSGNSGSSGASSGIFSAGPG